MMILNGTYNGLTARSGLPQGMVWILPVFYDQELDMNRTVDGEHTAPACGAGRGRVRMRGFTLIELLVVIAIISLLGTLVIPSLKQAKGLARTSICGSNLRMVGIAGSMYTSRSQDYLFPYSEWTLADEPDRLTDWYVRYALVTVWQMPKHTLQDADGFLSPYLPSNRKGVAAKGMGCPSVPTGPVDNSDYIHNGRVLNRWRYRVKSYAHNYYYTTWPLPNNDGRLPVAHSRIPRPAELVHMCESSAVDALIYPVEYVQDQWDFFTAEIPEARHFDEFYMVFVDGHVASGTLDDRFNQAYFTTPDWGD